MDNANEGLWDKSLIFVALLGLFFLGSAVYALVWARRQNQFHDFDRGARAVFDDEEPEGVVTDRFPEDAETPAKASTDAKKTSR